MTGKSRDLKRLKRRYDDSVRINERQRIGQLESKRAEVAIDLARRNQELEKRIVKLGCSNLNEQLQSQTQKLQRMKEILGKPESDWAGWSNDLADILIRDWSGRRKSKYDSVKVLLVQWVSDDLGVKTEIENLALCFTDCYGYDVETFATPDGQPLVSLTTRVVEFLKYDSPSTPLIFYYAGHGSVNHWRSDKTTSSRTRASGSAIIPSGIIQTLFEQSKSDALLLYDACHSADTATSMASPGTGVTELISVAGFHEPAPGVGKWSFSHTLTEVFHSGSKHGKPFAVSMFYSAILATLRPTRNQTLMTTPVHTILVPDESSHPRQCIMLEPLSKVSTNSESPEMATHSSFILTVSFKIDRPQFEADNIWQDRIMRAPPSAVAFRRLHAGAAPRYLPSKDHPNF
ncbi:hypothetical protein DL95DRAFT_400473 [Leptodontidium sp. 2 PMI_412]|nr:hypothetical protein DL95DRAFT_400473 [Leptodontidium sp. 2 PMI_412]